MLDALARQDAPVDQWEVLVIDNASTDGTATVAGEALARHFGARGRLVREDQPSLTYARRRAGLEARGEVVCFLDDDNLAETNSVRHAARIFDTHPQVGCAGGKILPIWEQEPPPFAHLVADIVRLLRGRAIEALNYALRRNSQA